MTHRKIPLLEPRELLLEERRELVVQAYIVNINKDRVLKLLFRKIGKKYNVFWQVIQRYYKGRKTQKQ